MNKPNYCPPQRIVLKSIYLNSKEKEKEDWKKGISWIAVTSKVEVAVSVDKWGGNRSPGWGGGRVRESNEHKVLRWQAGGRGEEGGGTQLHGTKGRHSRWWWWRWWWRRVWEGKGFSLFTKWEETGEEAEIPERRGNGWGVRSWAKLGLQETPLHPKKESVGEWPFRGHQDKRPQQPKPLGDQNGSAWCWPSRTVDPRGYTRTTPPSTAGPRGLEEISDCEQ